MLISRLRPLLGTFVAVEVETGESQDATAAVEAAYFAVGEVDRLMHPTRSGSDIARISAASPGTSIQAHPWTMAVLALARKLNEDSSGAFDPCLPEKPGRMRDLVMSDGRVTSRVQTTIDLGGIAKGFAVDRAVDELIRLGVVSGLVNAGGDLRVFGTVPRIVQVRTADGGSFEVELRQTALAASGQTSDSPAEHRGFYDGVSGARVESRAVTISASTTALADALCKCALLCEPELLRRMLEKHGARQIL